MDKFQFHRLFLLSILILAFCCDNLSAQCAINDLIVTKSVCDANDKFTAEINFNFESTGANGFQILGNGNNYGTFQYSDLPVNIEGLVGNCTIVYEFIIRDVDDPTCASSYELGQVCCDDVCSIFIVDFTTSDCSDNLSFGINLNLEYTFEGDGGYTVSINGASYGTYSYQDLPLNLEGINSQVVSLNTITICDVDFPECCDTYSFLNPCICAMTNITSNIVDCNSNDSSYFVQINFDHIATNDSFQMGYSNNGTNQFLGTFAYDDLPVMAGPIALSENELEILIVDTEDFFCFSSAYLGTVNDCNIECQLYNLSGEAYMCEEGEYFIDLEFLANDIEGNSFDILVDDVNYGTFEYGQNFYTVGPIPSNCDTAPVLIVQDSNIASCSDFYNFPDPICCLPDCNFTSIEVTTECSPSTVTVNGIFENNGVSLSGFYFVEFLGTSYGPFIYGNFTFSIEIPLISDGEYPITINDSFDPECQISTSFTIQCDEQPCLIFDVFAEASECEENIFFVDIQFDFAGEVSDSFEILGNGANYGTFAYGEAFYTVGPLDGDCETIYEFFISDQIFEGCNAFYGFEDPVCCNSACSIRDIVIIDYSCIGETTISSLTLDFVYENTPSTMFTLSINGSVQGSFLYAELPIQLDVDLPTSLLLIIQDSEISDCQSVEEFNLDCSFDCTITDAFVEVVDCSDEFENYFLELDVEHNDLGDSIEIYVNNGLFALISYAELPYVMGPFSLGVLNPILVRDADSSDDCDISIPYLLEACETGLEEANFSQVTIRQMNHFIHLTNGENEKLRFDLINTTGTLVQTKTIGLNGSDSFNTSMIPRGIYFLNISGAFSQKTMKVLVH